MRRRRLLWLVLSPGLLALAASACGGGADASAEARIAIHFSKFVPAELTVPAGVPLTLELVNEDPIEHEWLVGDADFHQRHRTGTEPFHDGTPTEVTIPALETRTTIVTFESPGEYQYICHLPNHEEYGMVGVLKVIDPED
jgi:plastocyanin